MTKQAEIQGFQKLPWHFSGSECAKILDIAQSSFSERGYEPDGADGRTKFYDIRAIIAATITAGITDGEGGTIDIEHQKARLTKAQAGLAETKLQEELKRLRPVEEIDEAMSAALTPVAAALDSLPMTIRRECPELSDRAIDLVQRSIAKMRNDLAAGTYDN